MPSIAHVSLRAQGLSVHLGGRTVISGMDLPAMSSGRVIALLGPNASGKSTLLKAISGLAPARWSTLELEGSDLRNLSASRRAERIRYLPQYLPGDVHLTVEECLRVALNARRSMDRSEERARMMEVMDTLKIRRFGHCYLDELSGGQKQMVALGQALVHHPRVLLLDEPLTALDLQHQHHVMSVVAELTRTQGLITMIVLHDLNMALRHADTALLMHEGALIASGEPAEVITSANLARAFSVRAHVHTAPGQPPQVIVEDLISTD